MVMITQIHSLSTFFNMTDHARAKMFYETIGIVFHIYFCYYFLIVKNYGIAGTGYASSLTNAITFTSMLIYT
jgi:Na+-driven multidrug efflux pump